MEHYWLVCYDICNVKRLRKVVKLMEGYGKRVQKSVFECWLYDSQLRKLKSELDRCIDSNEDDIRFYNLCTTCRNVTEKYTQTPLREQEKYFII